MTRLFARSFLGSHFFSLSTSYASSINSFISFLCISSLCVFVLHLTINTYTMKKDEHTMYVYVHILLDCIFVLLCAYLLACKLILSFSSSHLVCSVLFGCFSSFFVLSLFCRLSRFISCFQ